MLRALAMKIIDRYLGREILVTALFAIAVLSLVLVLGKVLKDLLELLVNHDVPLESVVSFVAYILPFSLTFTIPWGLLTAVLLVFGKLSAENELVALRSSGVSIPRLCLSLAALVLLATGLCFWINIDVAPRAQEQMKASLFRSATSNPLALFGSDEVITAFPGKKIYVEETRGTVLKNILMYDLDNDGNPIQVVHAREGTLRADFEGTQQVLLELTKASYEQRDANNPGDFMKIQGGSTMEKIDLPISLKELYEKNKKRRGFSQMTLQELVSTDAKRRGEALVEVNKRFSFSFASLAFALIGVPLAVTAQRKETSIGFFLSILVAFLYYIFIIFADAVRNNPRAHPEFLVWLPNLLFIGLGAFLFVRLSRR